MDMTFLRRAERMLDAGRPTRLDHALLMAAMAAQQAAGVAARQSGNAAGRRPGRCMDDPLTELLLSGPGWREALGAQRGCFSRAEAGRRINVL